MDLRTGRKVYVFGLTSEKGSELNDKIGVICAEPTPTPSGDGRYGVLLPMGPDDESRRFSLKRENLELLVRTQPDPLYDPKITNNLPDAWGRRDEAALRAILEYIRHNYDSDRPAEDLCRFPDRGTSWLFIAILEGDPRIVSLLIEYNVDLESVMDPNIPSRKKLAFRPLYWAVYNYLLVSLDKPEGTSIDDYEKIIELLIEAGADVNQDCDSFTGLKRPLTGLIAELSEPKLYDAKLRLVRKLLENGADPNYIVTYPNGSTTPLQIAATPSTRIFTPKEQLLELTQLLVDYDADPGMMFSPRSACHRNMIHVTATKRSPRILEVLLQSEKGRAAIDKLQVQDNARFTALSAVALAKGLIKNADHRECVVLLLKHGASVDVLDTRSEANCTVRQFNSRAQLDNSIRDLRNLIEKAPDAQDKDACLAFWDADTNLEVKAFIGRETTTTRRQCAACCKWSDRQREAKKAKSSGFMMCSKCRTAWYCSRTCQKNHWRVHKKVCKAPSCPG